MGKKLYCYYAKPTWTNGVPGIWAHFEDDRYGDGGVCLHWLRNMMEKAKAERFAAKVCG